MRRAGGEQANADDMVFLDRVLPQGGEPAVALAQIAADARDEDDEQRRVEDEAYEHADDVQGKHVAIPAARHLQRLMKADEDDETGEGERDDQPGRLGVKQHRRHRNLQQIERDKGVGRAAAEPKLRRQRKDIEHRDEEQGGAADFVVQAQPREAGEIDQDQPPITAIIGSRGSGMPSTVLHERDRDQLTDHGDPAKLDQQKHILAIGDIRDRRRSRGFGSKRADDRAGIFHLSVCDTRLFAR